MEYIQHHLVVLSDSALTTELSDTSTTAANTATFHSTVSRFITFHRNFYLRQMHLLSIIVQKYIYCIYNKNFS